MRGVIAEMRRVTWPSREEWIAATLLTIALVVGVGVFTYLCDLLFGAALRLADRRNALMDQDAATAVTELDGQQPVAPAARRSRTTARSGT